MIGIVVAGAVAMMLTLIITPLVIRVLRKRGFGQLIQVDLPTAHQTKRGTPTMGGLVFIFGAVAGFLAEHLLPNTVMTSRGALVIATMVALGGVGFMDDYAKIRHQHSLGLSKSAKLAGQSVCAIALGLGAWYWSEAFHGVSFVRPIGGTALPLLAFLLWVFLIISATSNGVNLTDGMDGLAGGSAIVVAAAFVIIGFWQFRHSCFSPVAGKVGCYPVTVPQAQDLAAAAAALMGALAGFLWYNAPPARIFMGDTGSLAIGGTVAALAVMTNTELLLLVIGGLYVVETLSVILQVASFRLFGKRIFKMAPIHLHFELSGWPEFTVIVRFWLLSGLAVAVGLALYFAEFIARGGSGG